MFQACGKVAASMIFEESVELLQPRVATLDAQSVANVRRPGIFSDLVTRVKMRLDVRPPQQRSSGSWLLVSSFEGNRFLAREVWWPGSYVLFPSYAASVCSCAHSFRVW